MMIRMMSSMMEMGIKTMKHLKKKLENFTWNSFKIDYNDLVCKCKSGLTRGINPSVGSIQLFQNI